MRERALDILVATARHPLLQQIAGVAAEQELLPVYLVGGFLRDALLESPEIFDIDLVSTDPIALSSGLQERLKGKGIWLAEGVRRVVFSWRGERVQVDIARLRRDGILEDLSHRDFTINALAVSLGEKPPRLIDPVGGLADLNQRRIRVNDPRVLAEDPLRLLRSVRLAAQLQFVIDETTAQAIRGQASLLTQVAPERVREEFFAILDSAEGGRWLGAMDELGLLEVVLPEIRLMRGCLQDPPHRYDVFLHSLEMVQSLDRILLALANLLPDEAARLGEALRTEVEGGVSRQAVLRFTALLHDVGKPGTRPMDDGQIRFLGHAARGADMVHEISRRLCLGSRASGMAVALVQEHLRPLCLREATNITPRARYRFFRDLGPLAPDVLILSLADIWATRANEGAAFQAHLRFVREMFAFQREHITGTGPPKLVDGHELMARMNLRPGPFVGFLLERIREETSIGALKTKEEAFQYLDRHLPELREAFTRGETP